MNLEDHIKEYQDMGCWQCELGIQKMPEGYALMLNSDGTHYFWLRSDGVESCIHWDKWAVYRGAKTDDKESAND